MREFLNWRTDSLLVDPEPLLQNTWLTANELLELKRRDSFITTTGQLLLYPIIIRKVDFISGERILQSFPYILLDKEWITKIRKQSLALAEKTHHYFQKSNYNRSIREWQKKIINYLEEQQRLPFPVFRLTTKWLTFFAGKTSVKFQSARGEDFRFPLFQSKDLTYLTGVIMGDGHLAEYFVNIIDSSKEHIRYLTQLISKIFNSNTEFFKQSNANAWNVNVLGKWIVRFFNFLSGQPINSRKYPTLREPLIFQNSDIYRSVFWRGLMDADGSYKKNIGFGTASEKLLSDFSNYLAQHSIQHRFYTQTVLGGTTYSLVVAGQCRQQFAQLIETDHPIKKLELQALLDRKVYRFTENTSTLRKRGVWEGQVITVNQEKLQDGYFDLSFVSQLGIAKMGGIITTLRQKQNFSQKTIATKLNISQTLLSKYERNSLSIPINIIIKLLSIFFISLQTFLTPYKKLLLQSGISNCYIETQPSDSFLEILRGLQFKEKGCIMIHGHENEDINSYRQQISDYFSIDISTLRFHNSVLNTFTRAFFTLRN